MNKSKINKYKINNNNKTNTKREFNVKYERYKQDISKDTLQMQKKVKKTFKFMFFMDENEIVEESYHTPILC
jgi:site-specific DNA-adenine methylase